jgi:hypothetical protein
MWPPSSPDINPLDFSFWNTLASKICEKPTKNRKDLIERIEKNWFNLLEKSYVIKTCASAWKRMQKNS